MSTFEYVRDPDGIVTVIMNMSGSANTMNAEYSRSMEETILSLEQEPGLRGVVITSAKKTFVAGGDLHELLAVQRGQEEGFFRRIEYDKACMRRLERLRVPVVAAINGAALGGGFELALCCNRRLLLNDPSAVVGLPEVGLGLLPGGGGTVRLVHLLGLEKALPLLLEGRRLPPADALAIGIVDELVDSDLLARAKEWLRVNRAGWAQPWDRNDHGVPGGTMREPRLIQWVQLLNLATQRKTRGLLPAPGLIISVAAESTVVDFDTALRVESRALAFLVARPESKNIISTMFFQMNQITRGASRPQGIPKGSVRRLGVLGAGMMGQGIAYVAAAAGITVVLRDVTAAAAANGKHYAEQLLAARVSKGQLDASGASRTLALITATDNVAPLAGCDLIVEAVFENLDLKAAVVRETEMGLAEGGIYASNTSTLPISMLAKASAQPQRFIGMHFFSPVDKMQLVELICGNETCDEVLAKAFDFVRQIGKIPIVVNDSLGFFTSRVFSSYLDEGTRLLKEGVNPVAIDNLARQIGMPIGPLAVQDEVSQQLTHAVAETHRSLGLFGSKGDCTVATEVAERLIEEFGRAGRIHGGGYYDYPTGSAKRIWPKLYELFPQRDGSVPDDDVKDRLLFRPTVESIKCLQDGVLRTVAEGNVGSILGIGAPLWTGGYLQFVNSYGICAFIQRAKQLADRYGERFSPPPLLLAKSEQNLSF